MISDNETISPEDFLYSVEAGENLSEKDVVFIASGNDYLIENYGDSNQNDSASSTRRHGQTITVPHGARTLNRVAFIANMTQGASYSFQVRRSSFTGPVIASGTGTVNATSGNAIFPFSGGDVAVTEGETLYLIFWTSGQSIAGNTTNTYNGGSAYLSTNSGSSFSAHPTFADLAFVVRWGFGVAGKAYKAHVGHMARNQYFPGELGEALDKSEVHGLAETAASKGNTVLVNPLPMVRGLEDLTVGTAYHVSPTTRGAMVPSSTSTAGTRVGRAVSTTALLRSYD